MSASKKAYPARPFALARYIAMSACCSSVSAFAPSAGNMAIPMLALTNAMPVDNSNGLLKASTQCSAIRAA